MHGHLNVKFEHLDIFISYYSIHSTSVRTHIRSDHPRSQYMKIAASYPSFATTVSQLIICDFPGEMFKGFEVL